MPTSDLDMPLLPSAEQIRRREFATVRRGYDPQQVRMYLASIAEQVETLERDLSQLRLEVGSAMARPEPQPTQPAGSGDDPYDALAKRFAGLIEIADQEAARTIDDARHEAAKMLDDARGEADRIRVDAQARAEEARQQGADLLERARIESDRVLAGLAERRDGLLAQLREMRETLLTAADDLAGPLDDDGDAGEAPAAGPTEPEGATPGVAGGGPAEARREDLWVSSGSVELPDLASLDLDFDDTE
jgi:cell division initiation protein